MSHFAGQQDPTDKLPFLSSPEKSDQRALEKFK